MEALLIYGSDSDSDDKDEPVQLQSNKKPRISPVNNKHGHSPPSDNNKLCVSALPPPPDDLLSASNSACLLQINDPNRGRIRSFPHVEGNFALHVYIPVPLSSNVKCHIQPYIKKALEMVPELESMENSMPSSSHSSNTFDNFAYSKTYHLSLSRTVPIRIHQIDSIVSMLRDKFESQKSYWLELEQWEVFVNDENTRSFLSLEVLQKKSVQISKQIRFVDEVFKLHKLPVFYEDPRPHVSVAWMLGKASPSLMKVKEELNQLKSNNNTLTRLFIWSHNVNRIECKIGNQVYCIWKDKNSQKAPH